MRFSHHRKTLWLTTSHRSGFTLVEVLIVIAMFSFVLASVSISLACLWRAQSEVQHELTQVATVMRLARQLRTDAHQANAASIAPATAPEANDPNDSLRFTQANSRIEYTRVPRGILRIVYQEERALHRETYMMDEFAVVSWSIGEPPVPVVRISIDYRDPRFGENTSPIHREQIEAVIGLFSGEAQ